MNKIIAIDCDGVLLNWEQSFDDWMKFQGFTKHASDHYDVSMNYHMNKGQCEVLIKIFNESAWMKFLKPIEGAVENVKKIADLGYKFHVITSQSLDKNANQLREENLKEVFGDNLTTELEEFDNTDKNIALQIVSGREGISLRNAEYLVYYNIDFSATSYWQSRDRMTTKDRLYNKIYWVFARNGIENQIYKAVNNKKDYTLKHFKRDFEL